MVQDFSFALFEFFPSRKLAVTVYDHMRLTLRVMFIACALGYVKSALLVWIDQNSLHWAQKLSSLHKFHSYCKVHYNGKHD